MTAATAETPAWRAKRDTVLPPTNNLFMRGAIIHRRRSPGLDWEPANAAAGAIPGARSMVGLGTITKADPEAARYGIAPYAGLEFAGTVPGGSQLMRTRKREVNPLVESRGVPRLPAWKYLGSEHAFVWGKGRRP